jgi:glycosyltransferase involved in cell wall biosynthesis
MASAAAAHVTPGTASGKVVFVGHTAALSGAELCLLDTAPHFRGAVACLFADGPLAAALRERGVSVTILEASRNPLRVRRDAGVLSMLRAVPGVLQLARDLARLTGPNDILYANTQKSWITAAVAALVWRRTVVWHLHDVLSTAHFSRLLARLAVTLANRIAAMVIVNSNAAGEAFVALGGRRSLLRVVYNGIDATSFGALPDDARAALRRGLGLEPHMTVVGLFGRITPWKGQHVLLEALEHLPRVRALIVGAPLFGEDDYLEQLQDRARTPALDGRVQFLGFRRDIPALMQAVDVVVHTSTSPEPFGRVIVEGMLADRPVIATAGGGVGEIVTDGVNGVLVEPGDARALAAAIDALAKDPQRARALAAAGRRTATQRFLADDMGPRIASALRDLAPATRS